MELTGMKINEQDMEWACKQYLLDQIPSSKYIQENSTVDQRQQFKEWIKKASLKEILVIIEQDSKNNMYLNKGWKYIYGVGLAAALGGMVGAASSYTRKGDALAVGSMLASASTLLYYFYKRKKDPCHQKCKDASTTHKFGELERSLRYQICRTECSIVAAKDVLRQVTSQKGKCSSTEKPEKCLKSLSKLELKWRRKIENLEDILRDLKHRFSTGKTKTSPIKLQPAFKS